MVFDKLLVMYPFPMYFFVSPHHKKFAKDLENGLLKSIDDGSFDELFSTHLETKYIFPLSKWNDATKIRIENPNLSPKTPLDNPKLWLNLE